jgi:hypothetical protein
MKAQLISHNKITDEHGNTAEIKMWRVAKAIESPHGYKYSLVYIVNGRRVMGYDNAEGKGDHRHYNDREEPYTFRSLHKLVEDFSKDIERFTEKLYESKKSKGRH